MNQRFSRLEMLIGPQGLEALSRSRVAVFGLGGVGSFAVEGLARAGIGRLYLVDFDSIDLTNTNRQLHALDGDYGRSKAEVMAARVRAINPACDVQARQARYDSSHREELLPSGFDYTVDAIDSVAAKVDLILRARELGTPIISCLGTGNKFDPLSLKVADISRTHTCPLARTIRARLRRHGVTDGVKVVFSTEPPTKPCRESGCADRRHPPGSTPFVPPVAGLVMAAEVVKDLLNTNLHSGDSSPGEDAGFSHR